MVTGAIRTDFILSAEIMVIALNEVADQAFVPRLIILVVVALVITAVVYGVVAGIVKMDDIGLSLTQRSSGVRADASAAGWSPAMPKLLVGAVDDRHGGDALGRRPHPAGGDRRPRLACAVRRGSPLGGSRPPCVGGVGGVLAWLVNTAASAVIGLVVGAVVVAIMHLLQRVKGRSRQPH